MLSKKFIAFVLTLISASILLWFDKLDSTSYQAILMMVAPLYFASDVGADYVKRQVEAEAMALQRKATQ